MSGEGTGAVQVTLNLLHLGDDVNKALITLRRNTGRRACSQRMQVLTSGHALAWGRSGSVASGPGCGVCLPCRSWATAVVIWFCCALRSPSGVSHRAWILCLHVFCWFKCNCCPFLLSYQLLSHFQSHLLKTVTTVSFFKWVCNKRESLRSHFALSMGNIAPNCVPFALVVLIWLVQWQWLWFLSIYTFGEDS